MTFSVYLRTGPSPSKTAVFVIPGGAPIMIYCQTPTTDSVPTSVPGHGMSWLWDLAAASVNGQYRRGFITDLANDNTPYQVRDPGLPDWANLGGLPLDQWCPQMAGNTHVVLLNRNDAYGWACRSNSSPLQIPLDDVQMKRACEWYYGTAGDGAWISLTSYYTHRNDAYSWLCAVHAA